jgi:hypothetical protein
MQALLADCEIVKDSGETWAQRKAEALGTIEMLSKLLNEANGSAARLGQMSNRVGALASGIAKKTAGLAEFLEAAREFDEQQRPTPAAKPRKQAKAAPEVEAISWPKYRTHPQVNAG